MFHNLNVGVSQPIVVVGELFPSGIHGQHLALTTFLEARVQKPTLSPVLCALQINRSFVWRQGFTLTLSTSTSSLITPKNPVRTTNPMAITSTPTRSSTG